MKKLFLLFFIIAMGTGICNAQIFHKNPERKLFGKSLGNKKEVKIKEPKAVQKAKKKQEASDRKLKKDSEKSVKRSQKRTIDIQTPDVQARMKQNQKDSQTRDKAKKNKSKSATKKAGKKYK
jgi:hypothetical protein